MKNLTTIITAIFLLTSITTAQNYSLSFDGSDDYVVLPDIDLLGNYTLSLNVKPTSYNDYNNFFNKYPAYAFLQSSGTGNIYAHPKQGYDCSTGQSLTLNEWYNVSLVFNSGEMLIYVDGGVIQSCDNMPNSDDNSYNLTIGKAARFDSEYLNGLIDDAAIWSTALSQSDIQQYINGNTPDTDNLVGHWNFNEGTGTTLTDLSGNGNDGTIYGATWSTDVPQPTNTHSLSFDGVDDYVDIESSQNSLVAQINSITISSWVRIPNNQLNLYSTLIGGRSGYGYIIWAGSNFDDGAVRFNVCCNNANEVVGSIDLRDNSWHLVTVTYDGSVAKIYIDGVLDIASDPWTGIDLTSYTGGEDLRIGGVNHEEANEYFHGNIDEVSIWGTVLTQEQIQSYMSTSLTGNESGLVGYWNFNEGSGTTLTDQTSNSNDGTISGATWSTDVPFSGTTTTSALTWSVQAQASLGSYNDNDNYLGVASDATNTFDAAYDEIEPPASPGSSISLYFPHPEWNSILGDNFSTDARPEIALTDTMQVWDFEVVSTDAGDATLTFVFSDVPSVPVILENTATGVRENLSNNETYTFTAVADSAHPFRVSIGDTTAPALALESSCTGPAILISDSTHNLGWTSTDGYEVDSVLVSFSSDSGTTYALQAALGTVSGYSWTVPDAIVMTAGKFKIKAQDYAGNNTEKISDYVFAIAGDSLSAAVTAGWTMWGVPINPANDTMSTNLNDDFTDYWVTYDYVNNGYTYDGILAETEGYWLGAVQDATIDVKGTPVDSNFTMSLSQGWELISNPLVLDVSVDSLTFTKNDTTKIHAEAVTAGWVNSIYVYSSTGYAAASTFSPWSGYWVAVLETGVDMTFPIHRHDGSGSARFREDDWMITFDAQVDGANDGTTMIGYAETATDGFDAEHDAVQPPNPPGPDYVSLFIAHPEWNYPLGDKFAKDIRASVPDDEYKEWLLSIESSESDVQLNWTLMNIPDDYEVGYNIDDGIYFNDMRSVGTINISADTEIIVRVGSQVLGIDDETIPDVYALQQNYPNPFNPITTLRYDLPEQSNVNIIIYDIMGRQVKTLVNTTQDAGFKTVIWDATNDYGKPVSAGVYLYKIQAGKFVQTKKMVLLK